MILGTIFLEIEFLEFGFLCNLDVQVEVSLNSLMQQMSFSLRTCSKPEARWLVRRADPLCALLQE